MSPCDRTPAGRRSSRPVARPRAAGDPGVRFDLAGQDRADRVPVEVERPLEIEVGPARQVADRRRPRRPEGWGAFTVNSVISSRSVRGVYAAFIGQCDVAGKAHGGPSPAVLAGSRSSSRVPTFHRSRSRRACTRASTWPLHGGSLGDSQRPSDRQVARSRRLRSGPRPATSSRWLADFWLPVIQVSFSAGGRGGPAIDSTMSSSRRES